MDLSNAVKLPKEAGTRIMDHTLLGLLEPAFNKDNSNRLRKNKSCLPYH